MEIIIKSESVLLSGHLPSYLFIFLTNFWVYHFFQFYHVFSDSGSFQCTQMDAFWCPGDPGTIPDWSWIDLGKVIFSSKFSKFWAIWWCQVSQKLICISITWSIWEYPDLKWSNTRNCFKYHQILPSGCWEKQKTKLKRDLNQEPKISRKFSIRGNYSWAYLL